jgi:pimeloyl-ACP methyl ester carboxylesterase
LHGKRDIVAPLTLAEELHRGIRGAMLVTFNGGHLFFLIRERQRFLNTVEDFVAS